MFRPIVPVDPRSKGIVVPPPRARTRTPVPLIPKLPTTIAFFDLSLTSTGVALYRHGEITTETWALKTQGMERLSELDDMMRNFLIREYPDVVGVEGYSYGSKQSRAHSIGEWGGVAKLAIYDRPRVKGLIASPATVKKFMTGNGNAPKSEMPLRLFQRYGIEVPLEDEADAACGSIMIGAHLHASAFTSLTQFQIEALKGIEQML